MQRKPKIKAAAAQKAQRMRIAIAGAGIGGLAAACLLATNGHQIDLFDQFAAPRPIGSGLMIQPMGLHVLDLCGAGDSVRANGQPIARMLGHDGARRILDVRYDPAGRIPRQGTAIHRATLHAALLNATLARGVTITPAMSVRSAPLHGNQRHLHMTNGTTHGPYDLVIDATGRRLHPLPAYGASAALRRDLGAPSLGPKPPICRKTNLPKRITAHRAWRACCLWG
jgi:2-polyprenyl-6-methoxyphenol hydroxylase-like FAD-dependent oxidoreductase